MEGRGGVKGEAGVDIWVRSGQSMVGTYTWKVVVVPESRYSAPPASLAVLPVI